MQSVKCPPIFKQLSHGHQSCGASEFSKCATEVLFDSSTYRITTEMTPHLQTRQLPEERLNNKNKLAPRLLVQQSNAMRQCTKTPICCVRQRGVFCPGYVSAAQPLTLETIEEKLVKDQQQQLPPSAELSATQSPIQHRAAEEHCSTIGSHAPLFQYLPPPRCCWRVPTSCRAPPPPPQL